MVRTRSRGQAPVGLLEQQEAWTERWRRIQDGYQRGDWATDSAKRLLRAALLPLTHGKCSFCESTLGVTDREQIEHYAPKTVNWELAFQWTNLFPACAECNRTKGKEDPGSLLLRPDVEDPEPYFWVHPDYGVLEPHPDLDAGPRRRAEETIRLLGLQRGRLCDRRAERRKEVGRWLSRLSDEGLTLLVLEEWEELVDPRAEYKFVIRRTLELGGQPRLAEEDRRRFAE